MSTDHDTHFQARMSEAIRSLRTREPLPDKVITGMGRDELIAHIRALELFLPSSKRNPVTDLTDQEILYRALCGYANWIETSDFCMSAADAHAAGMSIKVKVLAANQIELVARLRDLAAIHLR